jgi:signal transduction histidine kinase
MFLLGVLLAGLIAWRVSLRWACRQAGKERELIRRTRSAEKLAELGALASHLAHEIRNPLSIVKVNLQLLSEDISYMIKSAKNSEDAHSMANLELCQKLNRHLRKIETITKETDRLSDTLNDFLRYAGKMELHRGRHNVNEILDDLIDFYEPQAPVFPRRNRRKSLAPTILPSLVDQVWDCPRVRELLKNTMGILLCTAKWGKVLFLQSHCLCTRSKV